MEEPTNAPLDFEGGGGKQDVACSVCQQKIDAAYFTLGSQVACERCKSDVQLAMAEKPGARAALRAVAMGSLWGFLGAAVWWAVRVFANYEIGLIAVAIGYFVGKAVFAATGNRGGTAFQALAVALTYFWICANYVPDIVQGIAEASAAEESGADAGAPAGETAAADSEAEAAGEALGGALALVLLPVFVFGFAMAAPFFEGASNALGLLIIGFGLWQAWTMNKRAQLAIAGPFQVGASTSPRASG